MSVDAIAAIGAAVPVETFLPASIQAAPAAPPAGFAGWFAQEVSAVNTSLVKVDQEVRQLAVGETQSLHEVMIHMEEAKLSFQLLAQVRTKLLEAYQEVMRMQV